jgi:4-methoxybenzoate monooxygenase (O-demethylating)
VGLSDFRKEKPWRAPSILLEADRPLHTRTRAVVMRVVSRPAIETLHDTFAQEAEALVDRLVSAASTR